jgi:hypothetical protein
VTVSTFGLDDDELAALVAGLRSGSALEVRPALPSGFSELSRTALPVSGGEQVHVPTTPHRCRRRRGRRAGTGTWRRSRTNEQPATQPRTAAFAAATGAAEDSAPGGSAAASGVSSSWGGLCGGDSFRDASATAMPRAPPTSTSEG